MVYRCTTFDTKPRLNHRCKGIAKSQRLFGHHFPTSNSKSIFGVGVRIRFTPGTYQVLDTANGVIL